ncbi:MAG: hypothetical protein DIZ78_17665 [endosymbiont of Escarpia spicata]|uniref:PKD/Chitinase domain-containing protein n=1 Tax=endosymbiont of Escarpia spicata TaxID=2200908 RepID=A0A370D8G8_9GAMM|nr:MAG: hypothetical protein DIZ78_17665 [endosymbiont of Escarpia spicata]
MKTKNNFCGLMLGLVLFTAPSHAAVTQVNGSGEVTGATGVLVSGNLYDVEFFIGTCLDVFTNCVEGNHDFAFSTASDAAAAAQAIFDQVFPVNTAGHPSYVTGYNVLGGNVVFGRVASYHFTDPAGNFVSDFAARNYIPYGYARWSESTAAPPTAEFAFQQLTNIGNTALVRLDGTGSFDPDAGDVLTFQWTVDGMADCVGNLALCGVIDIPLGFGAHDVTLTVTDPEGASDEITKTVTLNPAELAVLEIDKSKVKFTENSYVKFHGEIGLPFGEDYTTLLAEAVANIYVAGVEILPPATVVFMPEVGADEWEYEGNEATNGISKFKIDWKGARYRFKESDYPINIKSHIITPTETVLTLKYKMKDIGGPFQMDIDGLALIEVDALGGATTVTAGVLIEMEEAGKEIALTLPFTLVDTSIITLSGTVTRVLYVVEGLKGSIGRFELEANFDASPFPAGAATLPRTIDLDIDVGAQRYFGSASLGESELSVKKDKWRSK